MSRSLREHTSRHRILLLVGFAVLLVAFVWLACILASSNRLPVYDFVEYWAAGRLNITGGNPYSPDELLSLQRAAGLGGDEPLRMWNPPWILALVMPFAVASFPVERLLWLLLNLGLLLACVTWIWWFYDGPHQRRWVALLVLATYLPVSLVLWIGQIAPLMLVGVLGFLYFEERRRWVAAGAFAALVAIKPHLIYLFWIALVLWVIERRAWNVFMGTVMALGIGTLTAWSVNHDVIAQYIATVVSDPPTDWITPTIGCALRVVFGWERFWLQLLPAFAGALWFLWYWRRERQGWRWADEMPLLLVVSMATTPYGWEFDQVILLLPILQVAIWVVTVPWGRASTLFSIGYLSFNGLELAMSIARVAAFWYLWLAPALLVWYLLARRWLGRGRAVPAHVVTVLRPTVPES